MKYTEYYEIMRDNYSIIVPKTMNQNTKFFSKIVSYCFGDRIYSSVEQCPTAGYFTITDNNKNISEDILMMLVHLQHTKKAGEVKSHCGSIIATYNTFDTNNKETLNSSDYQNALTITDDWQTNNYFRNVISISLGGYTLVHHMYNTEKYWNGGIKKAIRTKANFDQFVMLPSGLKFAWMLHKLGWTPDKPLVLFDISSLPIAFAKEMILSWDGSYPLHDWAIKDPIAKGVLLASGQLQEGTRPGAGPKEWDDLWQREIKLWDGIENIIDTMADLKEAEVNKNIVWCSLNVVTDSMGQDIIFKNLDNKPTVFWFSNCYNTSSTGSMIASDVDNIYNIKSRYSTSIDLYQNLKSKLPKDSLIIGSIPVEDYGRHSDGWAGFDWL
jgi:hypothetical protein